MFKYSEMVDERVGAEEPCGVVRSTRFCGQCLGKVSFCRRRICDAVVARQRIAARIPIVAEVDG